MLWDLHFRFINVCSDASGKFPVLLVHNSLLYTDGLKPDHHQSVPLGGPISLDYSMMSQGMCQLCVAIPSQTMNIQIIYLCMAGG